MNPKTTSRERIDEVEAAMWREAASAQTPSEPPRPRVPLAPSGSSVRSRCGAPASLEMEPLDAEIPFHAAVDSRAGSPDEADRMNLHELRLVWAIVFPGTDRS